MNETPDPEDAEQIEQLLEVNAQLRQQLVSLSALSVSLAQQQTGDPLISFGEGLGKRWINARSIRLLSLSEGTTLDSQAFKLEPSGTYAVLVDELLVTEYLPPDEAEQWLDHVADVITRALRPPTRKR